MLNKLTSVTLVSALVIVLCGTSALANSTSNPVATTDTAEVPAGATAKQEVKPNEQLKNNVVKLVADAKAGKVALPAKSQIQPAKSNNLSKGGKIALGVGIAAAVIVVFLIVRPALNDGQ